MQQGIKKKTPNTEKHNDKNVCAEYNMSTTTFKN